MKDMTPIAEGDVALKRKEQVRARRGFMTEDGERVSLATEERMEKRRRRFEAAVPVALAILEEARTALAVRFRFLDRALWRMPLVPEFDLYGIASDGRCLVFDPVYVVDRYKISTNEVIRDVLHCLFHCIFRHPFMLYSVLRQPWDVACDIAIEAMILDLVGEEFPSNMDRRAKDSLRVLRAQTGGVLTAERLYWLFSNEGNKVDLKSLAPMFYHDSHGLWYGDEDDGRRAAPTGRAAETEDPLPGKTTRTSQSSDQTEVLDDIAAGLVEIPRPQPEEVPDERSAAEEDGGEEESLSAEGRSQGEGADEGSGEGAPGDAAADVRHKEKEELARQWEELGRQIQVELETHLVRQSEGAGNLVAALKAVNREKGDYRDFLSRFAALHEAMRINDDEFDYIYYTYGLRLYSNLPLIEPLEYREDKRISDFVIAIDTSESCSGDVVQAFMAKTYSILKESESFHDRVNIHIIQCDAQVQKDTKITSLEGLEHYLEHCELKGFGGTDFRPVFDYVDVLVEKGDLTDLRGLLYFTDGEGVFPRKPPAYKTAFVFLDDGYTDPQVPPWALKVLLDERELGVGSVKVTEARRKAT